MNFRVILLHSNSLTQTVIASLLCSAHCAGCQGLWDEQATEQVLRKQDRSPEDTGGERPEGAVSPEKGLGLVWRFGVGPWKR